MWGVDAFPGGRSLFFPSFYFVLEKAFSNNKSVLAEKCAAGKGGMGVIFLFSGLFRLVCFGIGVKM